VGGYNQIRGETCTVGSPLPLPPNLSGEQTVRRCVAVNVPSSGVAGALRRPTTYLGDGSVREPKGT